MSYQLSYNSLPTLGNNTIGQVIRFAAEFYTPGNNTYAYIGQDNPSAFSALYSLSIGVWLIHATVYMNNSPLGAVYIRTYNPFTSTPGLTHGSGLNPQPVIRFNSYNSAAIPLPDNYGVIAFQQQQGTGASGAVNSMSLSAVLQITTTGNATNRNVDVLTFTQTNDYGKYIITATRIA